MGRKHPEWGEMTNRETLAKRGAYRSIHEMRYDVFERNCQTEKAERKNNM